MNIKKEGAKIIKLKVKQMETKSKKCQVVMLSSKKIYDEASLIWRFFPEDGELYYTGNVNKEDRKKQYQDCIAQHLYIISDDEIKEGDYFINEQPYNKLSLWKCEDGIIPKSLNPRKVIATTDPNLQYRCNCCFGTGIIEEEPCRTCIGGYTGKLPQPSKAFIEKYCKVGGIDEVMVDYQNFYVKGNYTNTCVICGKTFNETDKLGFVCPDHILPIVSKDNTITIHSIKDSWNREEVERLLCKYRMFLGASDNHFTLGKHNEWIADNL